MIMARPPRQRVRAFALVMKTSSLIFFTHKILSKNIIDPSSTGAGGSARRRLKFSIVASNLENSAVLAIVVFFIGFPPV
jgi:hypothetical protein